MASEITQSVSRGSLTVDVDVELKSVDVDCGPTVSRDDTSPMASMRHPSHKPWISEHRANLQDGGMRAAIFGMSDGLVSSVGLVIGVYAFDPDKASSSVPAAGLAGLLAGASSMAAGEWISMKSQSEFLERELEVERNHLERWPDEERSEMVDKLETHGIVRETAERLMLELEKLPEKNLDFHARIELGIDPQDMGNPTKAALYSFLAFAVGAIVPIFPWFIGISAIDAFIVSSVGSAICSFMLGSAVSLFTLHGPLYSGTRQTLVSIFTAGITFGVGTLFNEFTDFG
eukprot:18886_1